MEFIEIIREIVTDKNLHSRWLNTLSLMENSGARKISACEHKTETSLMMLKHAAEEHRHAYYLKKQIAKLGEELCPTYRNEDLLAPLSSHTYLSRLDIKVCRYLKKELGLHGYDLKYAAYLLVTYAIEVRADELYPVYQAALDEVKSKVNVKSIILEEEGHLEEMTAALERFSEDWQKHAKEAVRLETVLFSSWIASIAEESRVSHRLAS